MGESGRWERALAFMDLRHGVSVKDVGSDLLAGLVVTFMAVPQCVAYAVIAGMPPVMGLYAATIPAMVGALFRSSRHVITGPTNAVSLLVGGSVGLMAGLDPMEVGIALAVMVGVIQLLAGFLRLGALVDYISNPVVLGYITGAGLLIGVGQLHHVTGTPGQGGDVLTRLISWWEGLLTGVSPWALALAGGTALVVVVSRRVSRWIPGAMIALTAATVLSSVYNLNALGVSVVSDLSPVPKGLPPLTVPDLELFGRLMPLAAASAVLSLVESSAVARSIASSSGQRLELSVEFVGQGLANIAAGFSGGYPTSGSLGRSAINVQSGAKTRLSGIFGGAMMLLVLLLLGPLVNETPLASLAGLLMVVAVDLIKVERIKRTLASHLGDKLAFIGTLMGTWLLPLDQAIYLGVGISLVMLLRRARMLLARELVVDTHEGRLREVVLGDKAGERCRPVRVLHLEGRLFFGVDGELRTVLEEILSDDEVEVLVLRLKRTQGMDVTIATSLVEMSQRLAKDGRHLVLAGVREETMQFLRQTGLLEALGQDKVFSSRSRWFESMRSAVGHACALTHEGGQCASCPLARAAGLIDEDALSDTSSPEQETSSRVDDHPPMDASDHDRDTPPT